MVREETKWDKNDDEHEEHEEHEEIETLHLDYESQDHSKDLGRVKIRKIGNENMEQMQEDYGWIGQTQADKFFEGRHRVRNARIVMLIIIILVLMLLFCIEI